MSGLKPPTTQNLQPSRRSCADLQLKAQHMNIHGQAALVTGGGSGLGEATARDLARLGAKVAVLDLNMDNAQRVAQALEAQFGKGCAVAVHCNVSDPDSMAQAIATAADVHGAARILMQIAGIGTAKRVVGKDYTLSLHDALPIDRKSVV